MTKPNERVKCSISTSKHGDNMQYNIGDMVVRYCFGEHRWDMVGVITAKRPNPEKKGESYHTIRWLDSKKNTGATTWQVDEFDLVEKAKKVSKKT